MKRIFVSDLDGTLLNDQSKISEETAAELHLLMQQGVQFSVATARSIATVSQLLKDCVPNLPVILMNGACLYDMQKKQYVSSTRIEKDTALYVAELLDGHHKNAFFFSLQNQILVVYHKDLKTVEEENFYLHRRGLMPYKQFVYTDDYAKVIGEQDILYISMCGSFEEINPIREELEQDTKPGLLYVCYYDKSSDCWYLELFDQRASKENALKELRNITQADFIAAFGDNLNDLGMTKEANAFYAVANAHPDVLQQADAVIPSNIENGVVKTIRSIIENM